MTATDREAMVRYDQLAARVYEERRLPAGTRDLVLALGWATLRDPRRHHPEQGVWSRTRDILNTDDRRMWQLLADDVPRYEHDWNAEPRGCQAPMVRVDRLCERSVAHGFCEFDLHTGWSRFWGFCNRPRCRAYATPIAQRAEHSATKRPEPIPNTGGLLPLFFTWNWEARYAKAMDVIKRCPTWEPPSYGLSADQWPSVPGTTPVKAFPKLRLVVSDGRTLAPAPH
ncbi:hypothetical protein GT034_09575 [Streptomyces sp. SID2563]|uniref:hypothetical protein n=1 Tax=Streptomyces sp. SID2563 TaxID=2690255 RepID=UPI001368DA0A|nr:hypothetical protein [Streptomyces sp. SID2563]MYW08589.1 hypothetical protein [Streptomyces sp. SID2563]